MDEIEKLAREHGTGGWQTLDDMIRFGKAVQDAERERCAKLCDAMHDIRALDGFPREASTARALGKSLRAEWRKPGGLLDGSFI